MCFSLYDTQTNLGVSTVVGSDAINIYFVIGVILYKLNGAETNLDNYIFVRDVIFYVLGLLLLSIFYFVKDSHWEIPMGLLIYYFCYYQVQLNHDSIKETIYKLLGFIHDDDSFNADEHFLFKKRRDSLTFLQENQFVDLKDETLIKRLNRSKAMLSINLKDQFTRQRVLFNFQRMVFIVIYAIRNKHHLEKIKRSSYCKGLHSNERGEPDHD